MVRYRLEDIYGSDDHSRNFQGNCASNHEHLAWDPRL